MERISRRDFLRMAGLATAWLLLGRTSTPEISAQEPSKTPITPYGRVTLEEFEPSGILNEFKPTDLEINGLRLWESASKGVVVQPSGQPEIEVIMPDGTKKIVPNLWYTSFQELANTQYENFPNGYRGAVSTRCLNLKKGEDGVLEALVTRAEARYLNEQGKPVPESTLGAQYNPGADKIQVWRSLDGVNWEFKAYQ